MARATILLGRSGTSLSEEDFEDWAGYVSDWIEDVSGIRCTVRPREARDGIQTDRIDAEPDDVESLRETIRNLWEEWCERDTLEALSRPERK